MLRLDAMFKRQTTLLVLLSIGILTMSACFWQKSDDHRALIMNSTSPAHGARGVPLNAMLSVDFDRPMTPLTSSQFTLRQGNTPVPGRVSTSEDGSSATFMPSNRLYENTSYTAVVSREVGSLDGAQMLAERTWSFTTGSSTDSKAPKVTSARPTTGTSGIAVNTPIVITFDEALDPFSVNPASITLRTGTSSVSGTVEYGPGTTAKFIPIERLEKNTLYTANVSSAVTDLQGNRLANPMTWSFTTGSSTALGPASVGLGSSANYVILSNTLISTVPTSTVTGDIGLSTVSAETHLVGFAQKTKVGDSFATSSQVVGEIHSDASASPTPANLKAAIANMAAAYGDAASRKDPDYLDIDSGVIGNETLSPGLYRWDTTLSITSDITLSGGPSDVWIFQVSGDFFVTSGMKILLEDGAIAKNVFWQVSGQTILGPGAHLEGTILSKGGVILVTGASMNGRILTQGSVSIQQARVTQIVR